MRKVCVVSLCILLLCALAACGGASDSGSSTTTSATTTSTRKTISTQASPLLTEGYCVADPSMFVRSEPNLFSEVLGGLAYGNKVDILSRKGDWFCIKFQDGTGYVSAQYIRAELPQE